MDQNMEEIQIERFFKEALSHCRHKTKLLNFLRTVQISDFVNRTFEQVFTEIARRVDEIHGLGELVIYDVTSALCRHYQVHIERVYIIGDGPLQAIKLLGLKMKKHDALSINYVDIQDVIHAFDSKGFRLEDDIRTTQDGDKVESHLCVWQSPIKTVLALANARK
jgi:hypothetical protein